MKWVHANTQCIFHFVEDHVPYYSKQQYSRLYQHGSKQRSSFVHFSERGVGPDEGNFISYLSHGVKKVGGESDYGQSLVLSYSSIPTLRCSNMQCILSIGHKQFCNEEN